MNQDFMRVFTPLHTQHTPRVKFMKADVTQAADAARVAEQLDNGKADIGTLIMCSQQMDRTTFVKASEEVKSRLKKYGMMFIAGYLRLTNSPDRPATFADIESVGEWYENPAQEKYRVLMYDAALPEAGIQEIAASRDSRNNDLTISAGAKILVGAATSRPQVVSSREAIERAFTQTADFISTKPSYYHHKIDLSAAEHAA
jgi:hypothetical protein